MSLSKNAIVQTLSSKCLCRLEVYFFRNKCLSALSRGNALETRINPLELSTLSGRSVVSNFP